MFTINTFILFFAVLNCNVYSQWTQIQNIGNCRGLFFDTLSTGNVLMATIRNGLYLSEDDGTCWRNITISLVDESNANPENFLYCIGLSVDSQDNIYYTLSTNFQNSVSSIKSYRSSNLGQSWNSLSPPSTDWQLSGPVYTLRERAVNTTILIPVYNKTLRYYEILSSTDLGNQWSTSGINTLDFRAVHSFEPNSGTALDFFEINDSTLVCANPDFLFVSNDRGITWTNPNIYTDFYPIYHVSPGKIVMRNFRPILCSFEAGRLTVDSLPKLLGKIEHSDSIVGCVWQSNGSSDKFRDYVRLFVIRKDQLYWRDSEVGLKSMSNRYLQWSRSPRYNHTIQRLDGCFAKATARSGSHFLMITANGLCDYNLDTDSVRYLEPIDSTIGGFARAFQILKSGKILVTTQAGILRSTTDNGATWSVENCGDLADQVHALLVTDSVLDIVSESSVSRHFFGNGKLNGRQMLAGIGGNQYQSSNTEEPRREIISGNDSIVITNNLTYDFNSDRVAGNFDYYRTDYGQKNSPYLIDPNTFYIQNILDSNFANGVLSFGSINKRDSIVTCFDTTIFRFIGDPQCAVKSRYSKSVYVAIAGVERPSSSTSKGKSGGILTSDYRQCNWSWLLKLDEGKWIEKIWEIDKNRLLYQSASVTRLSPLGYAIKDASLWLVDLQTLQRKAVLNNGSTELIVALDSSSRVYCFDAINSVIGISSLPYIEWNWSKITPPLFRINSIAISSDSIYAGTDHGVWKLPIPSFSAVDFDSENTKHKHNQSLTADYHDGRVSVDFRLEREGYVRLRLVDLLGWERVIYSGELGTGDQNISDLATNLAVGTYFVVLESNAGTAVGTVWVSR